MPKAKPHRNKSPKPSLEGELSAESCSLDQYPLFDTHCHMDREEFQSSLVQTLQMAASAGVQKMVLPSCGAFNWQAVQDICQQANQLTLSQLTSNGQDTLTCYHALGLHPYFTEQHHLTDLQLLDRALANRALANRALTNRALANRALTNGASSCVAIGECGLDFYQQSMDKMLQQKLFSAQVELANQYGLPLILHCRKAHQSMVQILRQQQVRHGGVIHGFTGSYQQAMDFVELGFYIGVGGTITYPRAKKTRQTIASLPLASLVLETDAPDMPLFGFQGQPNHPMRVKIILAELIALRHEPAQTIATALFENSKRLFNIYT